MVGFSKIRSHLATNALTKWNFVTAKFHVANGNCLAIAS